MRILFAIEIRQPRLGFASPNSDYGCALYLRPPRDWYLAVDLEERRDVIEYRIVTVHRPERRDVNALRLLWKSTPALIDGCNPQPTEHGDFSPAGTGILPHWNGGCITGMANPPLKH